MAAGGSRGGVAVGTGLHSCRHYYASLLVRHGESVTTLQARLGHASAVGTPDTHLWTNPDHRTREAFDSVLGGPAAPILGDAVGTGAGPA